MILESTIDSGPDSGFKVKEWITFSEKDDIAWARLASICDAAGFEYEEASTIEAFAAQFPLDGSFRYSADIDVRYSVKAYLNDPNGNHTLKRHQKTQDTPYEKWMDVIKEEYETWEGDKYAGPSIRDGFDFPNIYQPPQGEAELKKEPEETFDPEEEEFVPDDALPF